MTKLKNKANKPCLVKIINKKNDLNDIEEGEEERKKGEEKRGDYRGVNNREFEGKKGGKEEGEKREEEREKPQNAKNRLNKSLSRI